MLNLSGHELSLGNEFPEDDSPREREGGSEKGKNQGAKISGDEKRAHGTKSRSSDGDAFYSRPVRKGKHASCGRAETKSRTGKRDKARRDETGRGEATRRDAPIRASDSVPLRGWNPDRARIPRGRESGCWTLSDTVRIRLDSLDALFT